MTQGAIKHSLPPLNLKTAVDHMNPVRPEPVEGLNGIYVTHPTGECEETRSCFDWAQHERVSSRPTDFFRLNIPVCMLRYCQFGRRNSRSLNSMTLPFFASRATASNPDKMQWDPGVMPPSPDSDLRPNEFCNPVRDVSHHQTSSNINLKNAVEHIKTPFALSQSKGGRGFDMLTKWVGVWKPLMVRQAHHERFPHASTDFFRIKGIYSAFLRTCLNFTVIPTFGTTCKDAGGRAPTVGALGDAGAIADDCTDAGGRAMQEQLPRNLKR